jgi:coenzyme Q-binding protein COQ10
MSSASIKKIIHCSKKNLVDMILDIEKYPEFVPWCLEGKIYQKKETKDFIEINADLKVGKKIINETYSSLVLYSKKKNLINVTNIEGPLKYLKNEWKLKEINNQTLLEFNIEFELKNSLLNMIMKNSFNFGLNRIVDAFEKRAIKLFKQIS